MFLICSLINTIPKSNRTWNCHAILPGLFTCLILVTFSDVNSSFDTAIFTLHLEILLAYHERCINKGVASIDPALVAVACLGPHQRAKSLIRGNSLLFWLFVIREYARVEAEFCQALMLCNRTVSYHQSWNHWRVDPLHDQVCLQSLILPISSLGLK